MKYHDEYNAVVKDFEQEKISFVNAKKKIIELEEKWSSKAWAEPDGDTVYAASDALDRIEEIKKEAE